MRCVSVLGLCRADNIPRLHYYGFPEHWPDPSVGQVTDCHNMASNYFKLCWDHITYCYMTWLYTMGSLNIGWTPQSDTSVFLHHLSTNASNFVHTFYWVD